jgi:predicted Zn-dependent protease
MELTSDIIDEYRNTGGFDIIGSGRTKLEKEEQFEKGIEILRQLGIKALVIIGGDDSNTNACVLAEYYAQKNYGEAYDRFIDLTKTNMCTAETWYCAAQCKGQLKDSTAMLALLDSAMTMFSKPYLKQAAPYLWARANAKFDAKKYRDAVNDMNDYEQLMTADVNANFYYIRHQAEVSGRLFQQALNDITQAAKMEPKNTFYLAEKAALEVRVGLYDQAAETANEIKALEPDNSDGYLFLGLSPCMKGKKKEGLENLQKAKELGYPQADELIEKYAK